MTVYRSIQTVDACRCAPGDTAISCVRKCSPAWS